MMNLSLLDIAIVGILGLLGVGLYGLLVCRNLFKVVVALQILVKAALRRCGAAGSIFTRKGLRCSVLLPDRAAWAPAVYLNPLVSPFN